MTHGNVELRVLQRGDYNEWLDVRRRNVDWLRPWEATLPPGAGERIPSFDQMIRRINREAQEGRNLPFALRVDGRLRGQVTVGGVTQGSSRSAYIGYWIDQAVAGRGLMPLAVAMATDICFKQLGLHRIEICVRPENTASIRVVNKLGFEYEGMRKKYLHIDGAWRDHHAYAMCIEDAPLGLVSRMASMTKTA